MTYRTIDQPRTSVANRADTPTRRRRPGLVATAGLVAAATAAFAASGCGGAAGDSTVDNPRTPNSSAPTAPRQSKQAADASPSGAPTGSVVVNVQSCTTGQNGSLKATVVVTNNTAKKKNVTVTVEWQDVANKRLSSDNEFIVDLQPGASTTEEAVGSGRNNPGTVHCVTTLS
jgi:hypothetical protein